MRIEVRSLSKAFGNFVVLDGLDFSIEDGEFIVVLGPSGCGKTTLLRIIAGLERPTSGTILFDGKDVTHLPPAKRDIGMVFQNYALYPHMTVYENLAFPLRLKKVPKEEIDRRVKEIATVLKIDRHLHKKPRQLSGGQRQRVALGRALIKRPKLFLFDEPLSNLDANLRTEMRAEIGRLHREFQTTSVYVTHDQVEAMSLADRILILNRGKIEQYADPLTVYNEPASAFVASFVGSPPMNLIEGEVEGGRFRSPGGWWVAVPVSYSGKALLGFRPEGAKLKDKGIKGTVVHREIFGHESIVYVDIGGGTVISVKEYGTPPRVGENVAVWVERYYLFDGEGKRLL